MTAILLIQLLTRYYRRKLYKGYRIIGLVFWCRQRDYHIHSLVQTLKYVYKGMTRNLITV